MYRMKTKISWTPKKGWRDQSCLEDLGTSSYGNDINLNCCVRLWYLVSFCGTLRQRDIHKINVMAERKITSFMIHIYQKY
jgi:hypothetical protein